MRTRRVVLAVATMALALSGCSGGSSGGSPDDQQIEWWHVQTTEASRATWQQAADDFMAENPGVDIEITSQDADAFKTALNARLQAGDPPDLFQTWGGGGLAQQVETGNVRDITADVEPWIGQLSEGAVSVGQVDGQQYAVPYSTGLTGFWYNKALFAAAGIDTPPTTWPEFMDAVAALRASGTTPIAVGEGDKWPGMAFYEFAALRYGGTQALLDAGETGDFTTEPFIQAGDLITSLVEADAFQEGFLGATQASPGGSSSLVANGQAAMELMGQWGGGTQASLADNGVGLGDDLGWFEFPTIPGAVGTPDEGFGGVDSFAVGTNAPPETIDFLEYISGTEVQDRIATDGLLLPTNPEAAPNVSDPILQQILETAATKSSQVIWLDQLYAPAVATAVNDNVQAIFAGTATPEEAAAAISAAAAQ